MVMKVGAVLQLPEDKIATLPLHILKALEGEAKRFDPDARFRFVGGCVRDLMLGRKPKDFDIVTNTTSQVLERMGLENVGKAFPVYLYKDPQLGQMEVAVARTEEKTGLGHKGFSTVPTGDFEDDMVRRDLTINAMAVDSDGVLYGPENAFEQLESKTLQNVSDKFSEDPLRVFRVARFSAQFGPGWNVSESLKHQMQKVQSELSTLPPDRVREEFRKAMAGKRPASFFEALRVSGCLDPWFTEIFHGWDEVVPVLDYGTENKWTFEQFLVGIGSVLQTSDSLLNRLGIKEQVKRAVHYVKANKNKLAAPTGQDKAEVVRLVQSGSRGVFGFGELLDCAFLGQNEESKRYLLACQQALNTADMTGVKGREEAEQRQVEAVSKVASLIPRGMGRGYKGYVGPAGPMPTNFENFMDEVEEFTNKGRLEHFREKWAPLWPNMMTHLKSLKFPLILYRQVRIKPSHPQYNKGVGVFWTWDKAKATAYWADSVTEFDSSKETEWVTLTTKVNKDSVDWMGTILAYLMFGGGTEKEIRLLENTPLTLTEIEMNGESESTSIKVRASNVKTAKTSAYPDAAYMVPYWTTGACWDYAWALHEVKGGKLYVCRAYYTPDPSDPKDEAYEDAHAVVSWDGKTFQDFKGKHTGEQLLKWCEFSSKNITRKVMERISDNDFKDQYLYDRDPRIGQIAKEVVSKIAATDVGGECPDCEIEIDGKWYVNSKCSDCWGSGHDENGDTCQNCQGVGMCICCRCEGTGVDGNPDTPKSHTAAPVSPKEYKTLQDTGFVNKRNQEDLLRSDPYLCYTEIRNGTLQATPVYEETILRVPRLALLYCITTKKELWPELEQILEPFDLGLYQAFAFTLKHNENPGEFSCAVLAVKVTKALLNDMLASKGETAVDMQMSTTTPYSRNDTRGVSEMYPNGARQATDSMYISWGGVRGGIFGGATCTLKTDIGVTSQFSWEGTFTRQQAIQFDTYPAGETRDLWERYILAVTKRFVVGAARGLEDRLRHHLGGKTAAPISLKEYEALEQTDLMNKQKQKEVVQHNPIIALERAMRETLGNGRSADYEQAILRNPQTALLYAAWVIGGPWPEAEHLFTQKPRLQAVYEVVKEGLPMTMGRRVDQAAYDVVSNLAIDMGAVAVTDRDLHTPQWDRAVATGVIAIEMEIAYRGTRSEDELPSMWNAPWGRGLARILIDMNTGVTKFNWEPWAGLREVLIPEQTVLYDDYPHGVTKLLWEKLINVCKQHWATHYLRAIHTGLRKKNRKASFIQKLGDTSKVRIVETETFMKYMGKTWMVDAYVGKVKRGTLWYWFRSPQVDNPWHSSEKEAHPTICISFIEGNKALARAEEEKLVSQALRDKLGPESLAIRAMLKYIYAKHPTAEFVYADDSVERIMKDQEVEEIPTAIADKHKRMKELGKWLAEYEPEGRGGSSEEWRESLEEYNALAQEVGSQKPSWKKVRAAQDNIYVKVTGSDVVPRFLYYWVENLYNTGRFKSLQVDSVIPGLRTVDVGMMPFYNQKIKDVATLSTIPKDYDFIIQRKGERAGRPSWPEGTQKTSAPQPTPVIRSRTYWHGTANRKAAEGIIKEGIRPSNEVDPHLYIDDESVVPQSGRIYLGRLDVAVQYASGASMHSAREEECYLFKIDGEQLIEDCEPDEDFIGALAYRYAGYTLHDLVLQPNDFDLFQHLYSIPVGQLSFLHLAIQKAENEADDDEETLFHGSPDWTDFVHAGNRVMQYLDDSDKLKIIESFNTPVAHKGAIRPVAGWSVSTSLLDNIHSEADLNKFGNRIL